MNAFWTFILCVILVGTVTTLKRIAVALEHPPACEQKEYGK